MNDRQVIDVAVGVIVNVDGDILLTNRASSKHQGGLWEFPGGKREENESSLAALDRELKEELGICPVTSRPLIQIYHDYGDCQVCLDVFIVSQFSGIATGLEGQPLIWVKPKNLQNYPFPVANQAIIKAIQLPDIYWITQESYPNEVALLNQLNQAIDNGITLIQLRLKSMDSCILFAWATSAVMLCHERGVKLLIHHSLDIARQVGADGVHLTSIQLRELETLSDYQGLMVAGSCHNAAELTGAEALGMDFALLSPVLATQSHPHAVGLGWAEFERMVKPATLPVYALGGMTTDYLELAWGQGAQGIAGIRAVF